MAVFNFFMKNREGDFLITRRGIEEGFALPSPFAGYPL
jgi:hypothetical protein